MKQKRADRANWPRVPKTRFIMQHIVSPTFIGYISLLCLDEVITPLRVSFGGQDICLVDKGYTWLQQFPQGAHYAITSSFDAQGMLVAFYIDIIKRHYLDANRVLWYEDLYLDLNVSPQCEIFLLDVDELDAALRDGDVSSLDYELAWREVHGLMTAIEEDMFPVMWMSEGYREKLLELMR